VAGLYIGILDGRWEPEISGQFRPVTHDDDPPFVQCAPAILRGKRDARYEHDVLFGIRGGPGRPCGMQAASFAGLGFSR